MQKNNDSYAVKINDDEFAALSNFIRMNYGINLTPQKKLLVMTRMNKVLQEKDYHSYDVYLKDVFQDKTGVLATELIDNITTNHTFLNREKDHFEFLSNTALPYLIRSEATNKDIRIWSAGCSNGAEPYSIAMTIDHYMSRLYDNWDTKILATDISIGALGKAEAGIFSHEDIENIPVSWKSKHFKKLDDKQYVISKEIKREVIFRRFNLMKPFMFRKKFHIIFCRNVMIYFNKEDKARLMKKFVDVLENGGFLLIGHSEAVDQKIEGLKFIAPSIYRKEMPHE